MSRKNALKKLNRRLTPVQMARREMKTSARRTVAEQLVAVQTGQSRVLMGHHALLRRGIFGRMKWMLFGR